MFEFGNTAKVYDKILADNPPAPPCTPVRRTPITGANQYDTSWSPYRSAEPDVLRYDERGYAYRIDEPRPTRSQAVPMDVGMDDTWPIPVDWPAGKIEEFKWLVDEQYK